MGASIHQDEIRELLDKQAITDVIRRYCRGIDRCDEEMMRSTYHADALDHHGTFKGTGWQWCRHIVALLPERWDFTFHTTPNILIEVAGDVAHGETYGISYEARPEGGERYLYTFGGRFVDRFERRSGEWRIANRVAVHEWTRRELLNEAQLLVPHEFIQARRDRNDISYER